MATFFAEIITGIFFLHHTNKFTWFENKNCIFKDQLQASL